MYFVLSCLFHSFHLLANAKSLPQSWGVNLAQKTPITRKLWNQIYQIYSNISNEIKCEKKWKEQVGESHCHDCSAHLQQLRQFLRRVTEALLQRQLKRLHLGVVTRPLGSQRVTDIAGKSKEIKGINMKKSKNKRFCKRKAPSSQSTFSFKFVQDQSFASLWFCPGFFRSVSLFNPMFLFSVTSPHTLSSRRFSKSCRRSFRTTRTSLAVTRGQNRLVSFMPCYAILRPLSQNLRWLPGCFQFNACVSNAQAFSSDHEAPLVGKTLSHPWNTSEKDLVTIHIVSTTLFHYLCYSSYVTLQPFQYISIIPFR